MQWRQLRVPHRRQHEALCLAAAAGAVASPALSAVLCWRRGRAADNPSCGLGTSEQAPSHVTWGVHAMAFQAAWRMVVFCATCLLLLVSCAVLVTVSCAPYACY